MKRYRIIKTSLGYVVQMKGLIGWKDHFKEVYEDSGPESIGWGYETVRFETLDEAKSRLQSIKKGDTLFKIPGDRGPNIVYVE